MNLLARLQAERGQALAEYGLLLSLIVVVAVGALGLLGLAILNILGSTTGSL